MPRTHHWTADHDSYLRRMRASGASWDVIATSLGISRWATSQRGHLVGAVAPARETPESIDPLVAELANPNREPLPAGHPYTWSLLTKGTLLDGAAYPWPPLPAGETPAEQP